MLTLMGIFNFLQKALLNVRGEAGFMGEGSGEGDGSDDTGSNPDGGDGRGESQVPDDIGNDGKKINYPEGFDETLKGNKSLLKFADDKGDINVSNLAKSYVNMEGLLGKDKINIPDETFTDEQWDQFFDKVGRPDREAYKVENKLPEGVEENEQFVKDFTDTAHKAGLLPNQAQKVLDFFNNVIGESVNSTVEQTEASLKEAKESLQKEWGDGYEGNVKIANHALLQFASKEDIEHLKESGFINDPKITKLFNKIGKSISEDKFIDNIERNRGRTPNEIQDTIQTYYKSDHPYMNRHHPQHDFYTNKMVELQNQLVTAQKNA